jgi:hypothetical protein
MAVVRVLWVPWAFWAEFAEFTAEFILNVDKKINI